MVVVVVSRRCPPLSDCEMTPSATRIRLDPGRQAQPGWARSPNASLITTLNGIRERIRMRLHPPRDSETLFLRFRSHAGCALGSAYLGGTRCRHVGLTRRQRPRKQASFPHSLLFLSLLSGSWSP